LQAPRGIGFGITVDVSVLSSVNIPSLVVTLVALLAVFRFKVGMIPILVACSILGLLYGVVTGSI
jgi:chromate transporter